MNNNHLQQQQQSFSDQQQPTTSLTSSSTFDSNRIFQGLAKHIADLEAQVQTLEAKAKEQEEMLKKLRLEVPMHGQVFERKLKRLSVPHSSITATTSTTSGGEIKWPAKLVRQKFLDFFTSRGHTYWPSAPVVPLNDPTLLFINSGMAQFKPLFLGQCDPGNDMSKLKRAHNTQKCIRAGGKHNDLDDVGKDSYHHTFFEMLGNWSFGDYFKKEAIDWAWELLTVEFKLDPTRLYATYFEGNDSVPVDLDAKQMWEQYLPKNHVLPFGAKENFWEMGPTGPCGPCTEIHYDRIGGRDASAMVNRDSPDVIEIWNLVFIQYNRNDKGKLESLPSRHVDTGMGFERLVSVLQDKKGNYETDIWTPIFAAIEKLAKVGKPYSNQYGTDNDPQFIDMAYRVVADHLRTVSFAIADGCEPSNDGRGYVLRRILRRAVRYGMDTLKCDKMFFSSLVPVLAEHMKDIFPELKAKQDHIMYVIGDEEQVFTRTIEKGRVFFEQTSQELLKKGITVIPGEAAFFMMASLGFPVDLTEIMAAEKKMTVDMVEYQNQLRIHREISTATPGGGVGGSNKNDDLNLGIVPKLDAFATDALEKMGVVPTINEPGKVAFDATPGCSTRIVAIFDPSINKFIDSVTGPNKTVGLVLERTNFYHEAGGQVGDTGSITTDEGGGARFQVCDTQSSKGFVVHAGIVQSGTFKVNVPVACLVDSSRRKKLAVNHTSTHLLNFGLREVLKRDTDQKGSLVSPDKLRFDFDSREPITMEQIKQVEEVVREQITAKKPVYAKVIPLAQAKSIASLRAVFGETYPDPVRVISVGIPVDELVKDPINDKWKLASIELCGGSHMNTTSDAQAFTIVQEEGIAKGIRRITAITGEAAMEAGKEYERLKNQITSLETKPNEEVEKALRLEIEGSATTLGLCERTELKQRLDVVKQQLYEVTKKAEKEFTDSFSKRVGTLLQDKSGTIIIVDCGNSLPESVASKLGPKLAGEIAKTKKASTFVITRINNEFSLSSFLIDSHVSKLSCDVLTKNIQQVTGGKGGGDKTKSSMKGSIGKLPDAIQFIKESAGKAWVGENIVELKVD
jgi:alanyl-tRNA synthetase